MRADVAAHVHVCDIDGQDAEGGAAVQAFGQHGLADQVGILQHGLMGLGGTDGGNDALAHAGDDGFFTGAAHQAGNVRAHGDTGLGPQLDTVLGHGGDGGRLNDLGGDAHLHGLQNIASCQVHRAGLLKGHVDIGLLGGDHGLGHALDVAARQEVLFQLIHGNIQAGLAHHDQSVHQAMGRDAAQPHANQSADLDFDATGHGADPQPDGHIPQEHQHQQQHDENDDKQGYICSIHLFVSPFTLSSHRS